MGQTSTPSAGLVAAAGSESRYILHPGSSSSGPTAAQAHCNLLSHPGSSSGPTAAQVTPLVQVPSLVVEQDVLSAYFHRLFLGGRRGASPCRPIFSNVRLLERSPLRDEGVW